MSVLPNEHMKGAGHYRVRGCGQLSSVLVQVTSTRGARRPLPIPVVPSMPGVTGRRHSFAKRAMPNGSSRSSVQPVPAEVMLLGCCSGSYHSHRHRSLRPPYLMPSYTQVRKVNGQGDGVLEQVLRARELTSQPAGAEQRRYTTLGDAA
jgi:hypothetical protein